MPSWKSGKTRHLAGFFMLDWLIGGRVRNGRLWRVMSEWENKRGACESNDGVWGSRGMPYSR